MNYITCTRLIIDPLPGCVSELVDMVLDVQDDVRHGWVFVAKGDERRDNLHLKDAKARRDLRTARHAAGVYVIAWDYDVRQLYMKEADEKCDRWWWPW